MIGHALAVEWVDSVPRIWMGNWIESAFDWVKDTFEWFFDWLADLITTVIEGLTDYLSWLPPLAMALVFAAIALVAVWGRSRRTMIGSSVGSFLLMTFIIAMDQWENAMALLSLVLVATVVSLAIGVPLGILAARYDPVSRAVRPVMDLLQTMPAFVWLIPVVTLFRTGVDAGLVGTVIFAIPPGVRLTELGIRQVDREVVEAGHAFGANPRQILREVQIPLALPTIMAGVNQVIMLALSMAVIAGLVGAVGLGQEVTSAVSRINVGLGFEAGLSVVALAIYLDRVTAAFGKRAPGNSVT